MNKLMWTAVAMTPLIALGFILQGVWLFSIGVLVGIAIGAILAYAWEDPSILMR